MKNQITTQRIKDFCDKIDIPYQRKFVEEYSQIGDHPFYGGKHCGSDAEHRGSEFIEKKLVEIGLNNVTKYPCKTARYQFNDATFRFDGEIREIKPYGYVSPGTSSEGISAEIVDIDKATKDIFDAIDVNGKIALIAAMGTLEGGNLAGQMMEAIRHGAVAILIYAVEDVLNEDTIRVQPPNLISEIPILGICASDAKYIQHIIEKDSKRKSLLIVDAVFNPDEGITYNVAGEIPGIISDEKIIFTAHLDHYFRCLQDNISTCATLLGIAKAIKDANIIPNRTIVFAFHGSHELGGQDSRYPYIYGSYKMTHESHPEWTGNAVLNINFEYTALRQKKLSQSGYCGGLNLFKKFREYAPSLIGGFNKINESFRPKDYYMMSWSDCISYHTAGIPTVCNDPISEQLYDGDSPYIGRDHSNYDNWEVFDEKSLEDNDRYYGSLALFIDETPYIPIDFMEQIERIRRELFPEVLESVGIDTKLYIDAVTKMENSIKIFNEFIEEQNNKYIEMSQKGLTPKQKAGYFGNAHKTNAKMLQCYKIVADELDKINAYDFVCLGTGKYAQNIMLMQNAIKCIEEGCPDKAFEEFLAPLDLFMSSLYFNEETVEHMQSQICGAKHSFRRTWAKDRELHVGTFYQLAEAFSLKLAEENADYTEICNMLDSLIKKEAGYIPMIMSQEIGAINRISDILGRKENYN